MNQTHVSFCIALMTAITGQALGGDINPPAGPIAPTMKPLDAIEPRICINELPGSPTAVHVITEPGNYYLTGDVIGEPGKNGIEIDLDGLPPGEFYVGQLVIDGNGNGIIGGPGTLDGVSKTNNEPIEYFQIKFCKVHVTSWGGDGLHLEDVGSVTLDNAIFEGNGGDGAEVRLRGDDKNPSCWIRTAQFRTNGGDGLGVHFDPDGGGTTGDYDVRVTETTATGNTGDGVRINNIGNHSIDAYFEELISNANLGSGISTSDADVTIRNSGASNNSTDGASIKKGDEVRLIGFRASLNGGHGFFAQDIDGNSGLDRVTVTGNGGGGIVVESSMGGACGSVALTNCAANNNTDSGVELVCTTGGTIRRCEASNNGISGFVVAGSGHVIIENIAAGNSIGGYSVPIPGNTLGPVVDEFAAELNTNPGANYVR